MDHFKDVYIKACVSEVQTKGFFCQGKKEITSQSKHKKIIKIERSRYWALLISVIAY